MENHSLMQGVVLHLITMHSSSDSIPIIDLQRDLMIGISDNRFPEFSHFSLIRFLAFSIPVRNHKPTHHHILCSKFQQAQ
jgi:hypothetical protein